MAFDPIHPTYLWDFATNQPEPVSRDDPRRWCPQHIGRNQIGDVLVSTVFLQMPFAPSDDHVMWFETLVFGGPLDCRMERYPNIEEAIPGHEKWLGWARAGVEPHDGLGEG